MSAEEQTYTYTLTYESGKFGHAVMSLGVTYITTYSLNLSGKAKDLFM